MKFQVVVARVVFVAEWVTETEWVAKWLRPLSNTGLIRIVIKPTDQTSKAVTRRLILLCIYVLVYI